jgi:hypothetical protein
MHSRRLINPVKKIVGVSHQLTGQRLFRRCNGKFLKFKLGSGPLSTPNANATRSEAAGTRVVPEESPPGLP